MVARFSVHILTLSIASIALLNNQLSAYCYRCEKIENDRAREQAERPQKWRYYDDELQEKEHRRLKKKSFKNGPTQVGAATAYLAQRQVPNQGFDSRSIPNTEFFEEEEALKQGDPVPPSEQSQFLKEENRKQWPSSNLTYSTLYTILKTKYLLETLDGEFTVFVPTDAALSQLTQGTLINLTHPENQEKLANLVSNHVVPKKLLKKDFDQYKNKEIKAISGRNLTIRIDNGKLTIDGAQVLRIEPAGYDGVIYIIDKVLIP